MPLAIGRERVRDAAVFALQIHLFDPNAPQSAHQDRRRHHHRAQPYRQQLAPPSALLDLLADNLRHRLARHEQQTQQQHSHAASSACTQPSAVFGIVTTTPIMSAMVVRLDVGLVGRAHILPLPLPRFT